MKTDTQLIAGALLIFIFSMSFLQGQTQEISQSEKATVIDTLAFKLENN